MNKRKLMTIIFSVTLAAMMVIPGRITVFIYLIK